MDERQGLVRRTMEAVGLVRGEMTSLGLQASADGASSGGRYVPADTTWSQILDYASGAGDAWPLDFYRAGLPISRDVAVSYATLNRCVTLIAGTVAQLITGGTLRVVDQDGRPAHGSPGGPCDRGASVLAGRRDHTGASVHWRSGRRLLPRRECAHCADGERETGLSSDSAACRRGTTP